MNWTKSTLIPVLATVFLHGVILWVITLHWQTESKIRLKAPEIPIVQAKIVQLTAKEKPKPVAEKPKKPTAKPQDDKKKQQLAEQRLKEAKAKKQAELERKKKAEAEKQRKVAAEKKRKEEEQRRKDELKKKEEQKQKEEKRRREEEAERKKLLEAQRQREIQQQLANALDEEEEFLQQQADDVQAQSYLGIIQQAVERNWSRPPSARNNMEVELVIQLIPTGEVVNVAIAKSSGNEAFDRSAVNAVKKAGRFPELKQMDSHIFERHFRRFRMKFRPEDLRL